MVPPVFCRFEKSQQLKLRLDMWVFIQTNLRFSPFRCFTQRCNLKQSPGVATNTASSGKAALAKVQISAQSSVWRSLRLSCCLLSPCSLEANPHKLQNCPDFFLLISELISGLLLSLKKPWKFVWFLSATILASSLRVELNCHATGNGAG